MKKQLFIYIAFFLSGTLSAQFDWKHTDGPEGSSYSEFFSNDKYVFLPENDFIFRSGDGISWEKITQPASNVFAVRHDTLATLFNDPISGKIYVNVSQDNGLHWEKHPVSSRITIYNSSIAITSTNLNIALEGKTRLYRSTDLGITWDSTYYPGQNTLQVVGIDDRIYTYGTGPVTRTDREGNNWKDVTPPLFVTESINEFTSYQDSIIWMITDDRIWKSVDGGENWTYKKIFPSNSVSHLVVTGNKVYAITASIFLSTTDEGNTWDTLLMNQTSLELNSASGIGGKLLISTWNDGIFRYDQQTQSLVESNTGLGKGYILELVANQDHIWANCLNGIYTYDLLTQTWDHKLNIQVPPFGFDYISVNDNGWVLLPGDFSSVQLSQDKGNTWEMIELPQSVIGPNRVQLLGNNIVVLDESNVIYSPDKGVTWESAIGEPVTTEIVSCNNKYFVAGDNFLYESSDGRSWLVRNISFNIKQLGSYKNQLYAVGKVADEYSLFVSSNNGIDWDFAGPGYFNHFDLIPYYFHDTYLRDADHYYSFVGSTDNYIKTNASDFSSDTIPFTQLARDYVAIDNVLYRGGDGMYMTIIEDPYITAVDAPENPVKQEFIITPNPVSDRMKITFPQDVSLRGTLSIYTSDGKRCFSKSIHSTADLGITTSALSPGWYRVLYQNDSGVSSASFVKQ